MTRSQLPHNGPNTGRDWDQRTESAVEQQLVTKRYDRMAWLYDVYDAPMEWTGTHRRRRRLLQLATGKVLEVGVGTGRNLPHYPTGVDLTAIDLSGRMLTRARHRADRLGVEVDFKQADIVDLPFEDHSFDTIVATCVFCSVADPVAGLRELGRVAAPAGKILLLEHVRPDTRLLGFLADAATAFTRRLFGFRANRRTEDNVASAGLHIVDVHRSGIWREIVARPNQPGRQLGGETV